MREFYDDRNSFGRDDNDDDNNEEPQMSSDGVVDLANLDLIALGLNRRILKMSVDLASRTWFWRFRSVQFKLKAIDKIYKKFIELISEEE